MSEPMDPMSDPLVEDDLSADAPEGVVGGRPNMPDDPNPLDEAGTRPPPDAKVGLRNDHPPYPR